MMWNAMVSALLVRASIAMVDGDPTWPDRLAMATRAGDATHVDGASPAMLMACRNAGLEPGRHFDLSSSIYIFGTAGSPLPPEGFRYVYDHSARTCC